jgi:glycosyltransferase involved in cell wall biosynthesis
MKIVIITPTRDEEKYIRVTVECMLAQTILPIKWIIVNDGSTDNTEEIIKEYIKEVPFIEYVSLPDRGYREPGRGVIQAFYEGYNEIENENYDILAKFDADLEFPPDTLETICNAFRNDPQLGITGGTRYDQINHGDFKKVLVPKGFVGGPTKFYRKKCFQDINGLIRRAGWDGVDTIKANMKGWKTDEIESLKIIHLKPTGTAKGEGLIKACEKYGDVSYYMGGYVWYFILRVIGRSVRNGNPKVGYYMVRGYIGSMRNNKVRESQEFRRFLKGKQIQNMVYWFKQALNIKKTFGTIQKTKKSAKNNNGY